VVVCASALTAPPRSLAAGASGAECGEFHEECAVARALGSRDAGICNVERLECSSEHTDEPGVDPYEPAQRPTRSGVHDDERSRP